MRIILPVLLILLFLTDSCKDSGDYECCIPPVFLYDKPTMIIHGDNKTRLTCPLTFSKDTSPDWVLEDDEKYIKTEYFEKDPSDLHTIYVPDFIKRTFRISCVVLTPCGSEISPVITVYYVPFGINVVTINKTGENGLVIHPIFDPSLVPDFNWKSSLFKNSAHLSYGGNLRRAFDGDLYFSFFDFDYPDRVFFYHTPFGIMYYTISKEVLKKPQNETPRVVFPYGIEIWVRKGSYVELEPCFFIGRIAFTLFGRGNDTKIGPKIYINNVSYSDAGDDYWCYPDTIYNYDHDKYKATYSIRVYDAIIIRDRQYSYNISEGQITFVSCSQKSGFPKPNITWYINTREYDPLNNPYIKQYDMYSLSVDWRAGSMSIMCRLQNGGQDLKVYKYLKVFPPFIANLSAPEEIILYNSTTVNLTCSVKSPPLRSTTIYWLINDENLSPNNTDIVVKASTGRNNVNAEIVLFISPQIVSIRFHDRIICVADDGYRRTSTSTIIHYKLSPSLNPSRVVLKTGVVIWAPLTAIFVLIIALIAAVCFKKITRHNYDISSSNPVSYYLDCRDEFKTSQLFYTNENKLLEKSSIDHVNLADKPDAHPEDTSISKNSIFGFEY